MLLSVLVSILTVAVITALVIDRRTFAPAAKPANPDQKVASSLPSQPRRRQRIAPDTLLGGIQLGSRRSLVALSGLLVLVLWSQLRLVEVDPGPTTVVIWIAGLAGIAALTVVAVPVRPVRTNDVHDTAISDDTTTTSGISIAQLALGAWSVVASILVWSRVGPRGAGDQVNDVVVLWVSAMLSLPVAVAGWPPRAVVLRFWRSVVRMKWEIVTVSAIAIVALLLRVFPFGGYPRTMSGDEGVFAIEAIHVTNRELNNYFAIGMMGNSNFWFSILAAAMSVFGETIGGSRILSGVIGALAVLPTYALARKHFGRETATLAAIILTVSQLALFWSRNTMNNVSTLLFVPLALWLLDAGLLDRKRMPTLLAGYVVGLSMLFYVSNRILIPIAALYISYAVLAAAPRSRKELVRSVLQVIPLAGLGLIGFAVTALPLLSHFWHHPGSFNSRINQVSVFSSGWLDQEVDIRGERAIRILARQFHDAALTPFANHFTGTILHPDPPLLGWALVIPTAIGLATVTLTFWRREHIGLAAVFWATIAGMAVTIGPTEPHKLVTAISVIAILAALGITSVARVVFEVAHAPRWLAAVAVSAAALAIAVSNLGYYFADPDRDADFSDPNSQIAQSIANEADRLGPGTTVYLLGAPWMSYGDFKNIEFIARDAKGIDIVDVLDQASQPPEIAGPTVFAVLSARHDELAIIRAWFPNGSEVRHERSAWGYLYTSYTVFPDRARYPSG